MFLKRYLVLYVLDSGFYFFNDKDVSFKNFISFENDSLVNDFFEKLPSNIKIKVVLDTTDEEILTEKVPSLNLIEKMNYKKVLRLKNLDKRTDRVLIDYVKVRGDEFARIYKLYKNKNISLILEKVRIHNLLVVGIYSSIFYFETFLAFNLSKKSLRDSPRQKIFVLRRSENSYRVLYIHGKSLLLTRVVDFPDEIMDDDEKFEYIARESDLTIRYLNNVNLFDVAEKFVVFVIDKIQANKSVIEKRLNDAFTLKNELVDSNLLTNVFSLLDAGMLCKRVVNPEYMRWFACSLSSFYSPAKLSDSYSDHVFNALLIRNVFYISTFITFVLGSYYIGSLTSKYFFISDKVNFLNSKISYLTRMKSDLEDVIDIPYDARDLQKIVNFSNKFPEFSVNIRIINPITDLANVLDKNKIVNLVDLKVERVASKKELMSNEFVLRGNFFISQPEVLYSDNLNLIYSFGDALKKKFSNIIFTSLPIEVDPAKSQNINGGMIMPDTVPFSVEFRWKYHE